MTLKEAILKSLEEVGLTPNYSTIFHYIVEKKYFDFKDQKTPASTVSATLGSFIRNGDTRVKRISQDGGTYIYYLTKNEDKIPLDILSGSTTDTKVIKLEKQIPFLEKDLHPLLSTYLKSTSVHPKTIPHVQSESSKDSNQTWTHPDMVGVKFLNLHTKSSQLFLKSINKKEAFKISSYEIKRVISIDSELKKAYFQAVSNSSWANYGYLVAFEFSNSLYDEMERLNESFGIGIIQLNSNPFYSKILYHAKYRELDIKTIDKLCNINAEFQKFIEQIEKLMSAEEKFYKSTVKELEEMCDKSFKDDIESEEFCNEKKIPVEENNIGI